MADSIAQKDFYGKSNMHYLAAKSTTAADDDDGNSPDRLHDEHLALQDRMSHLIAFHAEMMGDIMYIHQALEQHDAIEFIKAVIREVDGHVDNGNWILAQHDQVPPDAVIVPAVWAMRRKRDLSQKLP